MRLAYLRLPPSLRASAAHELISLRLRSMTFIAASWREGAAGLVLGDPLSTTRLREAAALGGDVLRCPCDLEPLCDAIRTSRLAPALEGQTSAST